MPDQSHWFVNLPEIYFQIHQKYSNTILEIPSALVFDIFSIIICFYTTPWQQQPSGPLDKGFHPDFTDFGK